MSDVDMEVLKEQAYLISRGVRPMALIGNCASDPETMLSTLKAIEECSESGAIPFVINKGHGSADYGYAASQWVIDVFSLFSRAESPVPERERGCILGLLLGYSSEAIGRYARMYDLVVSGTDERPTDSPVLTAGRERIPLA